MSYYDIYAISKNRDHETIERFLNYFCFRDRIENQEGYEIEIWENKKYGVEEFSMPISKMRELIAYGVKNPHHGYVFYMGDHLKRNITHIILTFTYDGKMIFGISIPPKDVDQKDNYLQAFRMEKKIAQLTNACDTSIQFEYPPSDDEQEFYENRKMWEQFNEEMREELNLFSQEK